MKLGVQNKGKLYLESILRLLTRTLTEVLHISYND